MIWEHRLTCCNNLTKLHNIGPLWVESIICRLRSNHKINIIHPYMLQSLERIKQPKSFANINRCHRWDAQGFSYRISSIVIMHIDTNTSHIPRWWKCGINVVFYSLWLQFLPTYIIDSNNRGTPYMCVCLLRCVNCLKCSALMSSCISNDICRQPIIK